MSTVSEQTELWGINARDHGAEAAARSDPEWTSKAEAALSALAFGDGEFTIEDIYTCIGRPDSPNSAGALLLNAQKQGLIEATGGRAASRIAAHRRRVTVWRGKS